MKVKNIILIISLLAVSITSNAQDKEIKKNKIVRFGVKAGVNFALLNKKIDFQTEAQSSSTPRISLHAGFISNINLYKKFSFQPEILLSIQGYSEKYTQTDYETERNVKLTYMNLPLMFQYKITNNAFIELGPQIGYAISAKYDNKSINTTTQVSSEQNNVNILNTAQFNKFASGINIGGGYNITDDVYFNLRYHLAYREIDTERDVHIKNDVIQLSAGYKF